MMYLTLYTLHPNIRMHILHTVLYTFPSILAGRICSTIKRFFSLIIISFIILTLMFDSGVILKGELDPSHSQRLKG